MGKKRQIGSDKLIERYKQEVVKQVQTKVEVMSTSYCNVLSLFRIVYHKECDIVYENQFGVISKSLVFGVVVNMMRAST